MRLELGWLEAQIELINWESLYNTLHALTLEEFREAAATVVPENTRWMS